ncbi:hypothetical protein PCANC_14476 [Puccinia coronata f. sp. avenae]|uniref:Uncharacterized protein n=1 Tax=Puccinia coronata f. sp. avenae TaxID=200324 RepID=A0A2N5USJ0_9BASI|nr:hypothetical protein PCANC_14476 [Puccinia coronata f. sp. avenae]
MSDTPKVNLDKELKILMVSLSQEKLKRVVDLVNQIKKLVAGNHAAVPILAPNVKQNTKGRPSAKKGRLTSTKRIQSAFEIVEEKIKKENTSKKRVLEGSGRKKAKQIKKSEDLENLDSDTAKRVASVDAIRGYIGHFEPMLHRFKRPMQLPADVASTTSDVTSMGADVTSLLLNIKQPSSDFTLPNVSPTEPGSDPADTSSGQSDDPSAASDSMVDSTLVLAVLSRLWQSFTGFAQYKLGLSRHNISVARHNTGFARHNTVTPRCDLSCSRHNIAFARCKHGVGRCNLGLADVTSDARTNTNP